MSIAKTHNEFPQAPFEKIEEDVSRVKRRSAQPCHPAAQGQAARSQHVAPEELENVADGQQLETYRPTGALRTRNCSTANHHARRRVARQDARDGRKVVPFFREGWENEGQLCLRNDLYRNPKPQSSLTEK